MRRVIDALLEGANPSGGRGLPSEFSLMGEWVSCLVLADGKTVLVRGENLRLVEDRGDGQA